MRNKDRNVLFRLLRREGMDEGNRRFFKGIPGPMAELKAFPLGRPLCAPNTRLHITEPRRWKFQLTPHLDKTRRETLDLRWFPIETAASFLAST